jgi:hypothetical protein
MGWPGHARCGGWAAVGGAADRGVLAIWLNVEPSVSGHRGNGVPAFAGTGRPRGLRLGRIHAFATSSYPPLLAAAAILTGGAAAWAAPPGPAAGSIWTVQPTVNPQAKAVNATNTTFASVSASGPDEAWAVGTFMNQKAIDVPLAEHWTGTAWTRVDVPDPAPAQGATLSGVDDLSPGNAWAVGTRDGLTLIEHWNGTAWSIVPSPNPATGIPGDGDMLTSISGTGPDDLWAAGWDTNEATMTISMLFEHWNGTKWTAVTTPTPGGVALAITAVSPSNVFAVGESGEPVAAAAAHWNGKTWSAVPADVNIPGSSQTQLTGISADGAGDVQASGYAIGDTAHPVNFQVPYVLHWTGTKFVMTTVPNPHTAGNVGGEGSLLNGITVLSPTDAWVVGATFGLNGARRTLTEQFNGTTWTIAPSPDPGHLGGLPENYLQSVASAGGGSLFAVGQRETMGQCCNRTLAIATTQG